MDDFYYYFHNHYANDAYKYMGCQYDNILKQASFRVYAPHATEVFVVGDFNDWSDRNPMTKITDGIFETNISNVNLYDCYKYKIKNGSKVLFKQDPYAFHNETGFATCSKVYLPLEYSWNDSLWMENRSVTPIFDKPLNIYEVHLGSWRRNKNNEVLSYQMIADKLIPYVKKMGYTHIEIMPVNEYPFDGSWGYQVTGYFSITSRYGTPHDFMYFVNKCHENNVGIIVDWVPAHFPKDDFGLFEFDGEFVYEDPEPTRREYKSWGTRIFNYSKPEVKSFLISSARLFFEKYHIDGIRVDAVAAMLYLNYDHDEWIPNAYGGCYNLEAVQFLKDLNCEIYKSFPNVLMIAEESTDFEGVTKPVYLGGLGFSHKWNMGWMNDTLAYMKINPFFKHHDHHKMTFSLMYAYNENFILPISHDEVVHGKCSLLSKMPGDYEEKFANMRAYLGYMMTHPGQKLLFMGCEFAQFIEWAYQQELDWLLLDYPKHLEMQNFVKTLNKLYLKHSELWDNDQSTEGFSWINANDAGGNTYSFVRTNKEGKRLVVLINFSGNNYDNYRIGVDKGTYKEILNSDKTEFGGKNFINEERIKAEKINSNYRDYSISVKIPAYSIVILKKA